MPIGSYLEENNYNLVKDIRPFDMPYQSYMQEIATKQQYWKIGADRIKSAYDQAANLNPKYTQGREYLKGFMTEASANLEKLSKADLAVMDNSQQVAKVFKPLFDTTNPFNRALLKDSQLNEHYKKQQQIADTYRTKDGGKEWNINNERYFKDAQFKYEQNAQNGDYSTIDSDFQNQKSYIPYYDYKKELTEIQEACKGFSLETQDVSSGNPMFMQKDSKKGCDPQRLAVAFQTGLSGRAKQQMHIDGYNIYRGNEDVLLRKFNDISINNAKKQIDFLEASIKGLKAGGVTKEEQAKINDYTQLLEIRKERYEDNLKDYNDAVKGNPMEYLKNNFEKIAGKVYFDELTNDLGESFRTDETKKILSPNAVAMQHAGFLQQTAAQLRGFQHDKDMNANDWFYKQQEIQLKAALDYELAKQKGELAVQQNALPTNLTPEIFGDRPAPKRTEEDFKKQELVPVQAQNATDYKTLTDYIHSKYNIPRTTNMTDFLNEHNGKDPKDQDPIITRLYKAFENSSNELKSKINMIESVNEQAKKIYNENNPIELSNERNNYRLLVGDINSKKEIVLPLSEKEMGEVLSGKEVNGMVYRKVAPNERRGPTDNAVNDYFINGERLKTPIFEGVNNFLYLEQGVRNKKNKKEVDLTEFKTKMYTDDWYSNGNFTKNTLTIKKDSYQDQQIRTMLGVSGGQGDKGGYSIVAQTGTGEGIYIQKLNAEGLPIIEKDDATQKRIIGFGAENKVAKLPIGDTYEIYGISNRYSGLGSDEDLKKYNNTIRDIRNVVTIFNSSELVKDSNFVGSEQLPGGRGIITTKTNAGRTANITVRKEGNNIVYIANISTVTGEKTLEASTPQELITQLNSF